MLTDGRGCIFRKKVVPEHPPQKGVFKLIGVSTKSGEFQHHRFLLKQHLKQIKFLNVLIGEFDERIERQERPFFEYIPLLDTIL